MSDLRRHKDDLERLIKTGDEMYAELVLRDLTDKKYEEKKKEFSGRFKSNYQSWYSESSELVSQLLPKRISEFTAYYLPDPKRKEISFHNYKLQDFYLGFESAVDWRTKEKYFNELHVSRSFLKAQCDIVKSCQSRLESSLFEIKQILRADLFDSELESAEELLKHRFFRAAGAMAGVVLEKHLGEVCKSRALTFKSNNPTISTYNDALKSASVIDVPTWRSIQYLGDIRNLCDHGKDQEPTKEKVADLIEGVKKATKTIF